MNNNWNYRLLFSLGIAILFGGWLHGCSREPEKSVLTIGAAASMKDALDSLDASFRENRPRTELRYSFASSGTLQRQIEQGAPLDVFVSAAARNMDELQQRGYMAADSRRDIARNTLVLIMPRDSTFKTFKPRTLRDLVSAEVSRIAIGTPDSVPAGRYAREALEKLGLWQRLRDKIVQTKDVREALTQVELGNVEAGLVYQSDVVVSSKARVAFAVPDHLHGTINYPAAVVKSTRSPDLAKEYVEFLTSPTAQATLRRYGFKSPAAASRDAAN